jgi:L,D-peptidoglycan transpeptidase YkuD (ErfK/YbiS/YcfS/YnhG family)
VEEINQVATIRFSRSEYKTGRIFASKIKARRQSIFASRYTLSTGYHKNEKGRWGGFDFKQVDPERLWVDEEEYNRFQAMHEEIAKAHAASQLQPAEVDDMDVDDDDPATEGRF